MINPVNFGRETRAPRGTKELCAHRTENIDTAVNWSPHSQSETVGFKPNRLKVSLARLFIDQFG